ncbi:hypothetical protein CsSME_00027989 [Camellia sinensis var. sinensis]
MSSPGGILNTLATALHGSIRSAPSIHRLRLGLLGRVLSPLLFFPISTHFTAPLEIPFAPTVLQLGSFHCLSRPPTDALRPIIPDKTCILCITATIGTKLADANSPNTVIASSLRKEVHDPWTFYLHTTLLRQAFAHCQKFPTAACRRSLGHVSVPVWLIILSDQLLIITLTQAPPRADPFFCSTAYGVLAVVSNCCSPLKGRFLCITHPSTTGNTTSRPTCMC